MKHSIKTLLATLVVSICLTAPVLAGPYEDGYAAFMVNTLPTPIQFWRPLAEQGNAQAQIKLGGMYLAGLGVQQDDAMAIAWFRKAAEQGSAEAQSHLGGMYERGKGVPQNYAESLKWYRKAAEQGHDGAQHSLGVMYIYGNGVPQDYVEAHKWLNLAAAQGNEYAAKARDTLPQMTPAQIAEAQRLAREWKPKK